MNATLTIVGKVTESMGLTQAEPKVDPKAKKTGKKPEPIAIKNLRIETESTNKFGIKVKNHLKVVLFRAVAKTADALGFKEGDHIFLDECRIESRPYEKDGKTIDGEDVVANVVAKISPEEYKAIINQMEKEREDESKLKF
jgi:hypothetical protein